MQRAFLFDFFFYIFHRTVLTHRDAGPSSVWHIACHPELVSGSRKGGCAKAQRCWNEFSMTSLRYVKNDSSMTFYCVHHKNHRMRVVFCSHHIFSPYSVAYERQSLYMNCTLSLYLLFFAAASPLFVFVFCGNTWWYLFCIRDFVFCKVFLRAVLVYNAHMDKHDYKNSYHDIDAQTCHNMMTHEDVFVIDVRTPAEFHTQHIASAHNMPLSELMHMAHDIPRNKKLLVYCASGNRSKTACGILAAQGFAHCYNVMGGINAMT